MRDIATIPTNPNEWDGETISAVREYCKSHGGECDILTNVGGIDFAWCKLEPDGTMRVRYYRGLTRSLSLFTFTDSVTIEERPITNRTTILQDNRK